MCFKAVCYYESWISELICIKCHALFVLQLKHSFLLRLFAYSFYSCAAWRMSCKMGSVVTFVYANLCMHTFITFFVFVRHIEFFKKVPFFAKIVLFPPTWFVVKITWEQAWAEIKRFRRGKPLFLSIAIWQYDKSQIISIRVLEIY